MFEIGHPVDLKTSSPASVEKLTPRQVQEKEKRPFVGEGSNYSSGVDEGKLPPAIGTEVDRQEQKQQLSEEEAERDDLSVGGGEMLSPARKKARTEDKGEETDEEFSSPFGSYLCQSPAPRSSPEEYDYNYISELDEDPPDELLDDIPQDYFEESELPPKPFRRDYPGKTLRDLMLEHKKYVAALYADKEGTLKLIEEATKNFEQDDKAPNY